MSLHNYGRKAAPSTLEDRAQGFYGTPPTPPARSASTVLKSEPKVVDEVAMLEERGRLLGEAVERLIVRRALARKQLLDVPRMLDEAHKRGSYLRKHLDRLIAEARARAGEKS